MDPQTRWVIPLAGIKPSDRAEAGSKALNLALLAQKGYRVPPGFCLTAAAYDHFTASNRLEAVIRAELERKPLRDMRWEEVWDCALRIRNAFLASKFPEDLRRAVLRAKRESTIPYPVAVRSTGSHEDRAGASFAGLHESFLNVRGDEGLLRSIKLVWASLWSDSAVLYKKEIGLEPETSKMAVLVQAMAGGKVSGVAFGKDPRVTGLANEIVESVPGLCAGLVSGEVDPDRWVLDRRNGKVLSWKPGDRGAGKRTPPLLEKPDLGRLHRSMRSLAGEFGWEPDLEWTGRKEKMTFLQARPVTAPRAATAGDKRPWYLSLKPPPGKLFELGERVSKKLIPELAREGERMAAEDVERLGPKALARELRRRKRALDRWRDVYEEDFIPFAHGVRYFGTYYNDLMQPPDPFEFVKLLQGEALISTRRFLAIGEMGRLLRRDRPLRRALTRLFKKRRAAGARFALSDLEAVRGPRNAPRFRKKFEEFIKKYGDVSYADKRLSEDPGWVLSHLVQPGRPLKKGSGAKTAAALEKKFLKKAGRARQRAGKVLRLARLSWRLRDDDNILLARVESQFLRALRSAERFLRKKGKLRGRPAAEEDLGKILRLLAFGGGPGLRLPPQKAGGSKAAVLPPGESPRQMTGNPASPGFASGPARLIRGVEDFKKFGKGDVLVCDAIQPQLTHLVPLASAVVERRGGMLIHGAIIARELGVPCVNGIAGLTRAVRDGDLLTVDGHLGIVSVGEPEFDLETGGRAGAPKKGPLAPRA